MNETLIVAVWGLLGAVAYAGPVLSACLFGEHRVDHPPVRCWLDALIAMFIGSFAAAAFSGGLSGLIHQPDVHAVAAIIGLLANLAVPLFEASFAGKIMAIVRVFTDVKP